MLYSFVNKITKDLIHNLINIIKDKNIRLIIESKNFENLGNKNYKLSINEKNSRYFNLAFKLDRIIVIKNSNKHYLCRIIDISDLEILVNNITEILIVKKFVESKMKLCEFIIEAPLIVLKEQFILPYESSNLIIGRENSVNSLNYALQKDSIVFITKQKNNVENPIELKDFYNIGSLSLIEDVKKIDVHSYKVVLVGLYRFTIKNLIQQDGINICNLNIIYEDYENIDFYFYQKNYFIKLNQLKQKHGYIDIHTNLINPLIETEDMYEFIFLILSITVPTKKQEIIYAKFKELFELLLLDISEKIKYSELENEINEKVKEQLNEKSKHIWIKYKIKALQKELNTENIDEDENMPKSSTGEDPSKYPERVKEIIRSEQHKLNDNPHEASMIKQHLKNIFMLPWYQTKKPIIDTEIIKNKMAEEHVGSHDIIDKIIAKINIRNAFNTGNVILLVGPQGVGKTSLAEHIAKALDLPFLVINCGGMSDSSLLLGHSRTYIGSQPGYIVDCMKKAKVLNPVILLDEVDKMNENSGKNPMNTLYRLLDPNFNNEVQDNYMEPTLDLSKVFWILTANNIDKMHPALIDRCNIIYMNGYCQEEKINIAYKIISKIKNNRKISDNEVQIDDKVIQYIINKYTHESGTRGLFKVLDELFSRCLLKLNDNQKEIIIKKNIVDDILQNVHKNEPNSITPGVGCVYALAYTNFGGEILPIQVSVIKNKKDKKDIDLSSRPEDLFTGNIQKVMKESLQVAITYLQTNAEKYRIPEDFFEKNKFHVHALSGAISKDGPSAGGAITILLLSIIKKIAIKKYTCLTGEIGLHGEIKPIGGLLEKLNAAERESILTGVKFDIYVPKENEKDLQEIHKSTKKNLNIHFVSHFDDLLSLLDQPII